MEGATKLETVESTRRERGKGRIWQKGRILWIQYYVHGRQVRESSKSEKKAVAERLLTRRLGEKAAGLVHGADPEKLRYEQMRDSLYAKYRNEGRRSLHHAKDGREYVIGVWPHLDNFFDGYRASEITTKAMRDFVDKRLAEGASKGTINGSLALLRSMFGVAFKDGLLRRDDIPYFPLFPPSQPRDVRLSPDEFRRLHQQLPDCLKAPARLAYYNGLRRAEVFGLKWKDVDWEAGVIRLSGSVTKTGEARMTPLQGQVITDMRVLFVNRTPGTELVFQKDGKPIGDFRRAWRSALRRAGLPLNFVFHGLRYCAASNLTSAGVPQVLAMKVTGHATPSIFKRYNLTAPADVAAAGEKVAAYIENGAKTGQMSHGTLEETNAAARLPN